MRFNRFTERHDYLHITHTTREVFEQSWANLTEKLEAKPEPSEPSLALPVADGVGGSKGTEGTEGTEPKKGQKRPKKGQEEAQEGGGREPKKTRKAVDVLLTKAMKLKTRYLMCTGQASAFIGQIGNEVAYNWISEELLGPVLEAQKALSKAITGVALQIVSGTPSNTLKKHYSQQELEAQLRALPVEVEPLCNKLQEEVQRLQRMHQAHGLGV